MRSPRIAFSAVLALISVWAEVAAAAPTPTSVWRTDFSQAMAEAKRLNRPLVLHFGAKWCGPCQRMERETLNAPELLRILDAGFVAAKLDVERQPQVQRQFKVESLPTDIILSPDGRVLSRVEGYQPRSEYLAGVGRIDARYAESRRQLAKAQAKPSLPPAKAATTVAQTPLKKIPEIPPPATPGEKLPPTPIDPPSVAVAEPPSAAAKEPKVEQVSAVLALDGYCPVTLRMTRTWKVGQKEYAHEHQGQVFYFASQKQVLDFKTDPNRFAPRLLGCDPVVLSESDLAILGSTKFGAFYEGELYLFETAETRNRFRTDPTRYIRTKHVLSPTDVKKRRA